MIFGFLRCLALFLVGIPVTVAGLFVVAVALPFRTTSPDMQRFTQYQGYWWMVTLPKWARLWNNDFDGALGDKRGWWNNYCLEHYGKPCNAFYSMWQWLAVRNPANYWSRVLTGLDVVPCNISKVFGDNEVLEQPGMWQWQLLRANHQNGKDYPRLYCVFPWWFDPNHCVMIDIGWKFKLKDNEMLSTAPMSERIKGSVFAFSPWKKL